jgi:hypothetical protein
MIAINAFISTRKLIIVRQLMAIKSYILNILGTAAAILMRNMRI